MKIVSGLLRIALLPLLLGSGAAPAPSPYVRILSLEAARSLGHGQLAFYLSSKDPRIAARAALAIGRTKQAAGAPLLIAHLQDPRTPVRALAVYGLGLLATGRARRALIQATADPRGAVRVAALDALGRYEAAHRLPAPWKGFAVDALIERLVKDPSAIVRARAAIALEAFRNAPQATRIAAALADAATRDRSGAVHEHAMWSIFRGFASRVGRGVLAAGLRDRDPEVSLQAIRAYGRTGDRAVIPALRPFLHAASWRIAEQAAQSIRQLEGKPLTANWRGIPAYVHLPPLRPDPLAGLPALPRSTQPGKLGAPQPQRASLGPALLPSTAASMNGPAPGPHPRVRIVTTKGDLYVMLYPEWAPLTVENFLNLANRGFYNGDPWFRVVPDFVVQTGAGPGSRDGNADAGYTIPAEENPLEQRSYVISMGLNYTNPPHAHAIRDSAGTQFYITLSPQYHLDRAFTVFGRVTSGFAVLSRLVESDRILRVERVPDQRFDRLP
ncbi:MAG: peptidylprolyl isomerase [Vulcanimicrobiaceae bacterium]